LLLQNFARLFYCKPAGYLSLPVKIEQKSISGMGLNLQVFMLYSVLPGLWLFNGAWS